MRNAKAALALAAGSLVALAGCETVAEEANQAVGFEYVAMLSPSGGGTGSGKAEISLNDATNMLCTDLELSGVSMTAGHIIGPDGGVIADIDVPDDNDSDDCDNITDAQLDAIKANPGNFKVHIAATTGDLMGTLRKEH
ncbi:MAG TPA: CHRD domain-containing protein [Allosphingosinicella sp.]|nr:CHRD domain-containing protein [Allosphingosinicella sp.]